ncbi:MAG: leucine-rich repeat domain-containing protein [Clostridia bacterium]|nr:leucine-rich repeat domain-containing protein [Clostridia bacterium]
MKRFCMGLTVLILMCALAFGALAEGIVADGDMIAAQTVDQAVEEMAEMPLEAEEALPAGEPEVKQVSAVSAAADEKIPLDKAHFPDKAFRDDLAKYDQNGDGALSPKEIKAIREYQYRGSARDLTGIAYLKYITKLNVSNSSLKTLDLSGNPLLSELYLYNTRLSSLDLSKNEKLTKIEMWYNDRLKSMDLSGNTRLAEVDLSSNKALKTLTLGKSTRLTSLNCSYNALTELDVSGLSRLEYLDCSGNKLSALDVGKLKRLKTLRCLNNKLTKLNVSKNIGLESLNCWNNQLNALDLSMLGALKTLGCGGNKINSLDLTKNGKLKELFCADNNMTSLKLASKDLYLLVCTGNKIKSIDLAKCPHLIEELQMIPFSPDNDLVAAWGCPDNNLADEDGSDCFHIDRSTDLLKGNKVLYTDKQPRSIRFSKSSITVKKTGTWFSLPAIIADPEGASIRDCQVDVDGLYWNWERIEGFRALKKGTYTIKITTTNGITAKLKVTVKSGDDIIVH